MPLYSQDKNGITHIEGYDTGPHLGITLEYKQGAAYAYYDGTNNLIGIPGLKRGK